VPFDQAQGLRQGAGKRKIKNGARYTVHGQEEEHLWIPACAGKTAKMAGTPFESLTALREIERVTRFTKWIIETTGFPPARE
jgi:hypothetical protein